MEDKKENPNPIKKMVKLSDDQKRVIAFSEGKSIQQLAQEYNVSHRTIVKIRKDYMSGPRLKRMPDKPSINLKTKSHNPKKKSDK
jgi:DNA-binding XRE family transcriptional regulator